MPTAAELPAQQMPVQASDPSDIEAEDIAAPRGNGFGNFFSNIAKAFAYPSEPGEVKEPGQSAKIPWGGVAALIPYEALDPALAKELKELYARSEAERREYKWEVFKSGDTITAGESPEPGEMPGVKGNPFKGEQMFDFHTHPRMATFGHEGKLKNTATNRFSPQDWVTYQGLIGMFPGLVAFVITHNGLLLYLKDKQPVDQTPAQSDAR